MPCSLVENDSEVSHARHLSQCFLKDLSRLSKHTHSRIVVSKEDPKLARLLGVVSDSVSKQLIWLNGKSLGSTGVLGDEFT